MSKQHCSMCLSTHLLYPMYVAFYDDGGHDLVDHIDGRLPECADCSGECVVLDSKEDAARVAEVRAERAAEGARLIAAEVEYLKCYAASVMGVVVAVSTETKLGPGGVVRFSRAHFHFDVTLPASIRDGHRLPECEQ